MENNLIEELCGEFVHCLFNTQSYMVARFKTEQQLITVTGPYVDFDKKEKYLLKGTYVNHPKYGYQFNYISIEKALATQRNEIISFLSSKTFHGIGKKTATKIYDYFKDDTLNILKKDFNRVYELDLKDKHIVSLQEGFESLNDPENETIFYLVSNGFNNNEAHIIFSKFKLATIEISKENPFRFYNEIYAISFDSVKKFAGNIEFDDKENKYKEAYLLYLITDYTFNTGDIYIEYEILIDLLYKHGYEYSSNEIIDVAIDHHYLILENEKVYLYNDYFDEKYIADYLSDVENSLGLDNELFYEAIINSQNSLNIQYDDQQINAIKNFIDNNFSIIVGGPGTGKTTIIQTMSYIFKNYFPYNNLIVVAPTGRAAKRINEICNVESKTIHSLLRWDKNTNTFTFNNDNPIMYDAIIIDEFSMVDNYLFASLLKASTHVKKICIIGDNNQLPSIKPGNLLYDLLLCDRFPITRLHNNYRQNEGNEIINLANDIIDKNVDLNKYHKDITFYDINNDDFNLISLINNDLNDGYQLDEIQVLTPMHKGNWGIENLNNIIQDAFNPKSLDKKQKVSGHITFREFDKILQLKNRPSDDVYNGDIGTLIEVNDDDKYLLIDFNDTFVFYQYDDLQDITLAYAMSVHKAQGSEYQIVYFIITASNYHMLSDKLIYTAISRSKKKLVIIGDGDLFIRGLNRQLNQRKTTLLERFK